MARRTEHYPFPNRKENTNLDEIIHPYGRKKSDEEEEYWHKKIFSKEVQMLQAQYFILEEELIETFEYVYPCDDHLDVYSPRYAQIIKGACNLFELVTHQVYTEIYVCDKINIRNFLTLDSFLDLKNLEFDCFRLEGGFSEENNIFKPYEELQWDKNSPIRDEMIPEWWTAYNKIKHNSSNHEKYATMRNALRAMCALAILFFKVYGPGVTMGKAQWYEIVEGEKGYYSLDNRISELFFHREGRIIYTH